MRDLILGQLPKDYDFATDCPIEESKKLFKKVIPTGVTHGTVSIRFQGHLFEVTRFRKDVEHYGRRAKVSFSDSWEEDQERRDLTINAIFCDLLEERFLDSQASLEDFEKKQIRFVGDPRERIQEDHLRALRFLRFAARFRPLGFEVDPQGLKAALEIFDPSYLSMERILDEISKIFTNSYDHEYLLENLPKLRLLRLILSPQLESPCLQAWLELQNPLPLAFYALQEGKFSMSDLRLPKKTIQLAQILLAFAKRDLSDEVVLKDLLHQVQRKDHEILAQAVSLLLEPSAAPLLERIQKSGEPIYMAELALEAKDLIKLGYQGKELGQRLHALLQWVWQRPSDNNPDALLKKIQEYAPNNQ